VITFYLLSFPCSLSGFAAERRLELELVALRHQLIVLWRHSVAKPANQFTNLRVLTLCKSVKQAVVGRNNAVGP
jgi:hypothetical protein